MRIDILTILPELIESPLQHSILKRAQENGKVQLHIHNIREHATDKHRRVDDYPYGGEAGMVLMVGPVARLIEKLQTEREYDEIIYTSPDGQRYEQAMANELSVKKNLMILCGHYKGLDQRVRDHFITREVSIGDYVLTGGELAALVMTDSIVRLLPGAISDETSALTDSFQDGLLAPPVYTRPANYRGWTVPEVLTSGHQANIEKWRLEQSLEKTRRLRPDLLDDEQ